MSSVPAALPIDPDPRHLPARGLRALEARLDRACGSGANPLRQVGALAMFSFWLSVASGAYVYIGFDTSAAGAWQSVRELEANPVESAIKSLHRYASFAFLALTLVHLAIEWTKGRYRGFRWFSWTSGVPPLVLAVACGMVGYWLVADTRGQYVATSLGEWVGVLPGVGASLMRNFVTNEAISDRLLSLLIFLHIGVGLFVLLGLWVHFARLVRPRTWPARRVGIAFSLALVALCVFVPALATGRADFARVPDPVPVDWLSFGVLPLAQATTPAFAWLVVVALTLVVSVAPWMRLHRLTAPQPAVVDPGNCNGCRRCFDDCPFGAVVMVPHPLRRSREMARVIADQCAACGICVGACPSSTPFRSVTELVTGIDLPQRPLDPVRTGLAQALASSRAEGVRPIVVVGCDHGARVASPGVELDHGAIALSLPCSAAMPPAFAEFALREGAASVLVADCGPDACAYRFGAAFTRQRLSGAREPHLRDDARAGIRCIEAPPGAEARVREALVALRAAAAEATHA